MKFSLASSMLLAFAVLTEAKRGKKDAECTATTGISDDGSWDREALRACCWSKDEIPTWCGDELSYLGSCDAKIEDEVEFAKQKWTCCRAEDKPEWCKSKSDDDEDGKKGRDGKGGRGKKDKDGEDDSEESSGDEKDGKGKRGKKGKKGKGTFRDELDEDWTKQHKRTYANWRKHCDCRPTGDGKITTWRTCEGGQAESIECEFGV